VKTLPIKPGAVLGLMKEFRVSSHDQRPLVVAGAPELAAALARELGKGAQPGSIRTGGTFEDVAALVYVLAAPLTETDERELKAAEKKRIPIVALLADDKLDPDIPYVLATDVVRVHKGEALPVERVADVVARRLGEDAAPLAARIPLLRRPVARDLVTRFSRRNGVLGAAVFVPGADMPLLTLHQLRMVMRLAQVHGHDFEKHPPAELIGVVGAGFGLRAVARELLDFVPGPGWLLKGAFAYGATRALGEAAHKYFESKQ
jgi:uncharacterized protein (DUF697 family)